MTWFDERGLGSFIDTHHRNRGDRLFRMERLPVYDVPHQAAELTRWRSGAVEPNWPAKQAWLDVLAREHGQGLVSRRVRCFGNPMTDDEIMSCNWGYSLNGRYEEIRVLRVGEHDIPADLIELDYWLVADRYAVTMHYDQHGRFEGAELLQPDQLGTFVSDQDRAWAAAEPFASWWTRHGELHRLPVG